MAHANSRRIWLGRALVVAGVGMAPWLVVLGVQLPDTITVSHWADAWVGLDGLEALGLTATGLLYLRRDPRVCLAAAATAAVLVLDAWFDVTTSAAGHALDVAIVMAVVAELPSAVVCTTIAVRRLAALTRPTDPAREDDPVGSRLSGP